MLRVLRDEPGLVALFGSWLDGQSIIGFRPVRRMASGDDPFEGVSTGSTRCAGSTLRQAQDRPSSTGGLGFGGGWIGAWGYQLGARLERLPSAPQRPYPQPDFHLAYFDHVLRHTSTGWVFDALVTDDNHEALDREFERISDLVSGSAPTAQAYELSAFAMTPNPDGHLAALRATLDHIAAGDIFQANLCIRLGAEFQGDPLDVFCQGVEALSPAYGAFLRTDNGAIASFSPELFLRRRGRDVLTSPIKGTAPLASDVDELLGSAKNRAENIMIVDLMRNDLGRVCEPGSIRASATVRAEKHSVWHLVSDVEGRLRDDASDADLLRATFPPGSVTGAPKVRAMEIINTLEATGRDHYTGAIGFVSPIAGLELNVVIRTFEFAGDRVWLGVGGGIVADSTPESELAECLVKAAPLITALGSKIDDALVVTAPEQPVARIVLAVDEPARPDPALGIYDTLLVIDGRIIEADAHRSRIADSLATLAIDQDVWFDVEAQAALLDGRQRLRVDLQPGRPATFTHTPLVASNAPWSLSPLVIDGGWGSHKWRDREPIDLAGVDRAYLLVDPDGSILETGRSSVFVVRDEGVFTPPLDGRILPGIARARVIDLLKQVGIPLLERRITADDLADATEVFVTNSLRGVTPVTACEGVGAWRLGLTTAWLAARLEDAWAGVPPAPHRVPSAAPAGSRVLLIDNYDSFVYNLAQYLQELGAHTDVLRNDSVTVDELVERQAQGDFTHLVISPGPGTPAQAGISNEAIARLGPLVPTLGVCLGHQCIGEVYGASIVRAPHIVHGKPSLIHHDGRGVYAGLDGPLVAARYHSLAIDPASVPDVLQASAHTAAGVLMGVRHREHPIEGVQMHPESILTPRGHGLLANFLASVG
ncbi:hypothetical protein BH09ACT10_BH09ACT10_07440 [soil metagenome]